MPTKPNQFCRHPAPKGARGVRAKSIRWDYNGDGRYWRERLPRSEKRRWRKWNGRRIDAEDEHLEMT
jgi:hypothetical protein